MGSFLIVESLDRLSRDDLPQALELFISIVNAGVQLVTLFDDKTYSRETLASDQISFMFALMQFATAGEESKKKSKRLAAVWKAKKDRSRETNAPLSSMVPSWLMRDRVQDKIIPIPERVAIVREIFQLSIDGYGCSTIARMLNQRQEPVWRPRKGGSGEWGESYIKKILANRAVLGEYRPHKNVFTLKQKTTTAPDGEPMIGYYPPVIDEATFYLAAEAARSRLVNGAGRKGPGYSNLFTGLLRCRCGAGMRYVDKGPLPKGGQYLSCASSVRSGRCKLPAVRYHRFEEVMLQHLEGLNIAKALGTESVGSKRSKLESERTLCAVELEKVTANQNTLLALLGDAKGHDLGFVRVRAEELQLRETALQNKLDDLNADLRRIELNDPESYKRLLDELLSKLKAAPQEEREHLRRMLASEIKKAVASITLSYEPLDLEQGSEVDDVDIGLGHFATIDYHSSMTQILSVSTAKDLKLRWSRKHQALKESISQKKQATEEQSVQS